MSHTTISRRLPRPVAGLPASMPSSAAVDCVEKAPRMRSITNVVIVVDVICQSKLLPLRTWVIATRVSTYIQSGYVGEVS